MNLRKSSLLLCQARFHDAIKQHILGARGDDDFRTNQETGEVIDQHGDEVGNLNDENNQGTENERRTLKNGVRVDFPATRPALRALLRSCGCAVSVCLREQRVADFADHPLARAG